MDFLKRPLSTALYSEVNIGVITLFGQKEKDCNQNNSRIYLFEVDLEPFEVDHKP